MRVLFCKPAKQKRNLLIEVSPSVFIDSYNGGSDWETTTNKKYAWLMTEAEAAKRLPRVKLVFPQASIIKA